MAWLDFIKTIRQNDDQEKKRAQQGGFAGFVGRGLNLVDNTIDKGAEVTRNVNQDLGNYFTPKANQIRTRDFLRELPGATVKVGTGIGKFVGNTAQSINRGFVNTYLSGKEPGQQSPEDRKKAIDELTSKYSEEERNKLADEAQSGKVKSGQIGRAHV